MPAAARQRSLPMWHVPRGLGPLLTLCLALASVLLPTSGYASSVFLEELSWTELRDRQASGTTTVLLPIGATEQSGPYIALGKHNTRARLLAEQIATRLGNAVVAPVLAYVPEGRITPPVAHMRFTGTISISEASFEALLESAARSFHQHGFRKIVFLGDHGGYQKSLQRVAATLNREWKADQGAHVDALPEYYRAASTGFAAILKARGFSQVEIGLHAGLADAALSLALDKNLVRSAALAKGSKPGEVDGASGDARLANAELGKLGVQLIVDASVAALQSARDRP